MTADDLLAFEQEIADEFAAGNIKAPIHLSGGNEQQLIDVFRNIGPSNWLLCGWRSHYHCLLKGVPRDEVKEAILDGKSVSLCFGRQKVLCSGIMGGIAPIAVGLAWAIKNRGADTKVWCFLGDMAAQSGIVHEAIEYASRHDLPVRWVIEDNGLSVCTDTQESWGKLNRPFCWQNVKRYHYKLSRPHSGIGKWVRF